MKTSEHYGIGINTARVAVIMFFGAICFATGYYTGWQDRAVKLKPKDTVKQSTSSVKETPAVKPLQVIPSGPLPPNHPPILEEDQHGHPTFDCRALQAQVSQPSQSPSINQLFENRTEREGEAISLNAIVVGAYYKILGTNWYHLCDAPSGQVLVVSSNQLVDRRTLITVSGKLNVDFDLSGVYRFPLYIKDAKLSGDAVKAGSEETPQGVIKL